MRQITEIILNIYKNMDSICNNFNDTLHKSFSYYQSYENIKSYIAEKSVEELGKEISASLVHYTRDILDVVNSENLPSSLKLKFLDKIVLFNDKLHLKVFKPENKKTKRVIVKHLSKLLAESFKYCALPDESITTTTTTTENGSSTGSTAPFEMNSFAPKLTNMLSENKELSDVVEKMSSKLMNNGMDPMQLLGSLMSGNMDSPDIKSLLSEVEEDVKGIDPVKIASIAKSMSELFSR